MNMHQESKNYSGGGMFVQIKLTARCGGGSSFALYIFSFQVQHSFLQKATKQTSNDGKTSSDASPMPLEELHGTTLTRTAKRATLQHGWEASKHSSSTRSSPKKFKP